MAEDGDILILLIKNKKVELVFDTAYSISLQYFNWRCRRHLKICVFQLVIFPSTYFPVLLISFLLNMRNSVVPNDGAGNPGHKLKHWRF